MDKGGALNITWIAIEKRERQAETRDRFVALFAQVYPPPPNREVASFLVQIN